jgi:predicted hydrolase (HD superfamily)
LRRGADELGVDFDQHLQLVIGAMEERADELGLLKEPSDHPA